MEEPSGRSPTFVVSLLIERSDMPGRLLMGVRTPRHNPRHPGVLSTITQRAPLVLADTLVAHGRSNFHFGVQRAGMMLPSLMAEAVMARKLGIGQFLEQGMFRGQVSLVSDVTDVVDDPLGTQISELTRMITLRVRLTTGAELIPTSNASYMRLDWVETGKLSTALTHHDALILIPDADPFLVCIHGLCVRSAAAALYPS
ncbi:MAG TPA: hypothetical protein VGG05_23170 [Pseudonocardiaceae bacterium]|jgi:hypothetical protein